MSIRMAREPDGSAYESNSPCHVPASASGAGSVHGKSKELLGAPYGQSDRERPASGSLPVSVFEPAFKRSTPQATNSSPIELKAHIRGSIVRFSRGGSTTSHA